MQRFTLRYTVADGSRLVLRNLANEAVEQISAVQRGMGARAFSVEPQSHHYSQLEIELIALREREANDWCDEPLSDEDYANTHGCDVVED